MNNKFFIYLLIFSVFTIFSCTSSESNSTSDAQISTDTGIPERYLVAAKEFCTCHGDFLQIQYDGQVAKQNQDITKMAKLGEQLEQLPSREDCSKAIDAKMEQLEKEDGGEIMEKNFDAAAEIHCPIFIQILDMAEQFEDIG